MSKRTFLTPEQKISILREHLIDKVPVSDLCDGHNITPVSFYQWQKLLFENGANCFQRKSNAANERRQEASAQRRAVELEEKLQQKNEVIAELLQEHVLLKKARGGP